LHLFAVVFAERRALETFTKSKAFYQARFRENLEALKSLQLADWPAPRLTLAGFLLDYPAIYEP